MKKKIEKYELYNARLALSMDSPSTPTLLVAIDGLIKKLDTYYQSRNEKPTDLSFRLRQDNYDRINARRKLNEKKKKKRKRRGEDSDDWEGQTMEEYLRSKCPRSKTICDVRKRLMQLEMKCDEDIQRAQYRLYCKRTNIKTRVNGDGHVNIAQGGTDEEDAGSLLSDEVDSVDNTALVDTGIRRVKSFPGRCEFVLYNGDDDEK